MCVGVRVRVRVRACVRACVCVCTVALPRGRGVEESLKSDREREQLRRAWAAVRQVPPPAGVDSGIALRRAGGAYTGRTAAGSPRGGGAESGLSLGAGSSPCLPESMLRILSVGERNRRTNARLGIAHRRRLAGRRARSWAAAPGPSTAPNASVPPRPPCDAALGQTTPSDACWRLGAARAAKRRLLGARRRLAARNGAPLRGAAGDGAAVRDVFRLQTRRRRA